MSVSRSYMSICFEISTIVFEISEPFFAIMNTGIPFAYAYPDSIPRPTPFSDISTTTILQVLLKKYVAAEEDCVTIFTWFFYCESTNLVFSFT